MSDRPRGTLLGVCCLFLLATFVLATILMSSVGSSSASMGFATHIITSADRLSQEQPSLNVDSLEWERPDSVGEAAILSVHPGQDHRLTSCGDSSWEDSMLVLADAGGAYCISGFDPKDADSVAAARGLAMKLLGKSLDEAQLDYLKIRTLLGFAQPESPDAARFRDEADAAWADLTLAEQEELSS